MSKILYTASTMSHINNFHLDYINALRSEGHTVLTMARGEGADFNIPFEKKLLSPKNTRCRKEIKRILENEKFDIVILNTTLSAFHIRLAMPRRRPRVLNIVHGYLFSENTSFLKRKVFLFCERMLRRKTDAIIVMNDDDYRIATKNKLSLGKTYMSLGMGAKKKTVSEENVRLLLKEKNESYVMSFVGELSKRKNQEFLISSLPRLNKKIGRVSLWLVGDGGERERLEALAAELGVSENVRFFGSVPNPCDFIAASDLYVSASIIEGLPFNILEAMSVKATVVASDIKGQKDIISDGVDGFLYPYGDMDAFVKTVCDAYSGKRTLTPDNVFASYERYSFDTVFEKTLAIIKESVQI